MAGGARFGEEPGAAGSSSVVSARSNDPLPRRVGAGKPADEMRTACPWPLAVRFAGTAPAEGTVGCENAPLVVRFGGPEGGPGVPAPIRVPLDDTRGECGDDCGPCPGFVA